jgi:hypothetical protein
LTAIDIQSNRPECLSANRLYTTLKGEPLLNKSIPASFPIALLACILIVPSLSHGAPEMREGLWKITSQAELPGMPMKIPPTTFTHCYSKKDIKDRKNVISTDKNCTVTDMKTFGNKVSWTMKCTGSHAGTMTGETIFGNDSYTSVMHTKMQGYDMTTKMNAKRLGDCQ